jgi:hypothetical protein
MEEIQPAAGRETMPALVRERTVLLIQPRESAEPAYPLAIASLIPILQREGWQIAGVDTHFDAPEFIVGIAARMQPAWIGAVVLPQSAAETRDLFAALRKVVQARTFVFGALPFLDPVRALRDTGADIALGEAVEAAVLGLDVSDSEPPPGGAALRDGRLLRGAPLPAPAYADLPLPDRTLFPVERYSHAVRAIARPYAAVVSSRGCGLRCPYCPVDSLRPGFTARQPEQVYEEMERLARDHGIRSVHFEDDNFLRDRGRVLALCELLTRKPLPVIWELLNGARPTLVDSELLRIMDRAGCRRIVFSFEHIEPQPSDTASTSPETAFRAVNAARAVGMRIGGYFIVGLPGRSLADTLRSLQAAFALRLDYAKFSPFQFTPGSTYALRRPELETGRLPERLARNLCRAAELGFFAQPQIAAALLRDVRADPTLGRVVAGRAWELLKAGGTVPLRS